MRTATLAECASGRLRGRSEGRSLAFTGVPYARVPARFAAPAPAAPWAGTRDAVDPGPACPQPDRAVARFTHGDPPPAAEDCLNLNIYTPSLEGRRPVMVWLHGGGFATGHASSSIYDGSRLSEAADAVVVTVNYRLGSFGWLRHEALAAAAGGPAGNWGLLDQIAALQWVRENAVVFGGDPGRVTVAGQSAGALCALDLLVAPGADGLFARLILQSPPLADAAQPAARGIAWAEALSARAGARGRGCDPARLRALDGDALLALQEELLTEPEFRATRGAIPTIDSATLAVSPVDEPAARAGVEIVIGWNGDEGTFFFASPWRPAPAPERIPDLVAHLVPGAPPEETLERHRHAAATAGRASDPGALLVAIATESMFAARIGSYARARARAGARVYAYRFDHPGAGPVLGATHTAEVPLLFGTWEDGGPGARLGGQAPDADRVAVELTACWRRFLHGEGPGWDAVAPGGGGALAVFGGVEPLAVAEWPANRVSI